MAKVIIVYLILVNLFAFILYGIDKDKSRKKLWRISERTLLGIAAIGGSLGALIGMRVFHHKTKHRVFCYGVPAMLIVQLAAILLVVFV